MKFKGTKGKWMFNHNMVTTVSIRKDDTICLKPSILDNNWEANALLISKAPEMLEMLGKCRDMFLDLKHDKNLPELQEIQDEIEQLIKEATEINP